ncbi:anoctamin-7 [Siniperca chuatsi]|uniref:anoctamin-7 n=1 Tax=Siniperca chuatsi TaxID=119488 RepID=UPI001CE107DB|nr:anoctamin-7 [Siniperca chuatsi]XP_044058925.1 anoctamin-7 [Siniperca chuatsi]XP_044058926.1 anoctamin-7 [Siniperca chuatsi]XP_044058928.1 anoctamin-7 [Siniperca chuatsi]
MRRRGEQREDSATLIAMETKPENNYGSIAMNAPVQPQNRNVFSDGSTRVDFVLVWEEPLNSQEESTGVSPAHRKWRETFLNKLRGSGLLQEQKEVLQTKTKICFVLLSAPWSVLCYYAEEISLRVPLQVVTAPIINWSEQVLSQLSLPNPLSQDVPNPPPDYYTCQFRTNKLQRFLGSDDRETFFKTTQRHQVLYEILARTPYGSVKRGKVGIDRLLSEKVFTAAYPLHEGGFQPPTPPVPPQSLGLRQILYVYWAQWSCYRRYQPLDHIREYFGEKIALYFAWLGFYTGWLLPASLVGTVIFLFGFWLVATDVPAKELCDSGNSFIMCPLCNICSQWNYSSICVTYKAGLLFDNGGTVFLSVFMSLWAVTFLEYWKRSCSALSHRWDCSEFEDIEERPRPEFTAMAPMTMRNPVTGAEEPYFPENKRLNRTLTGCMVIIIMVAVVLMFLIAIILYRTILSIIIYKSGNSFISFSAGRIASISGSVLNLLVILMLSRVYTSLAHILTRWEMHRTQTKYEDMFILKVFIFQFVNFYSSPVYIAFFKGRFVGYPGNYNTLFGVRNEDCGAGGCLIELAQEMLVIMVGKQLINNIQEFITPKLKSWWQKKKISPRLKEEGEEVKVEEGEEVKEEQEVELSPWEADHQLLVCEGLFSEYLEMVLQFGFITIFVAACPLAPLFALVNNWVEIRLDAQKFVTEYRRPVAERAQDIGIWFPILQFITHIAVLSNAFLIAFTSSFLPRLYYRYTRDSTLSGFINFTLATSPRNYTQQHQHTSCRYRGFRDEDGEYLPEYFHLLAIQLSFVIVFEHVVFCIGRLIDLMVPDIPEEVEMKMKREHYMAKEALAENQSLGTTMIPSEKDVMSSNLRQRGSRSSPPPQSDSPPPNLREIPEEPDTPDSC